VQSRNGTGEVKGKKALNFGGCNSKNQTAGGDSSPAFKYPKFQTTSTDPIFITHTRTNGAFLEGKPEKNTYGNAKGFFLSEKSNERRSFIARVVN
jgi:hypothetical protein